MKKLIILFVAIIETLNLFSQDVIVLKNGDEVKSKVLEVTSDQVKYKKWDNLTGPSYTILKSEIFMVKYENGTKDVFKTEKSTSVKIEPNDDVKKKEALANLQNYIEKKINRNILKLVSFKKTNGMTNNILGQESYTIIFDVTLQFLTDGWLKGNDFEGYWNKNFYVYSSVPDVSNSIDKYTYAFKKIPVGSYITLGCEAKMVNSDNGFIIDDLSIKTSTDNTMSYFRGYYDSSYSTGDYNLADNAIYYKSNSAKIITVSFEGASPNSTKNNVLVKGNAYFYTNLLIDGFKNIGGNYSYTYSVCFTLANGEVYDIKEDVSKSAGKYNFNGFEFLNFGIYYNTPTVKNPNSPGVVFNVSFKVKDNNSDAIIQGFYKFKVIP